MCLVPIIYNNNDSITSCGMQDGTEKKIFLYKLKWLFKFLLILYIDVAHHYFAFDRAQLFANNITAPILGF